MLSDKNLQFDYWPVSNTIIKEQLTVKWCMLTASAVYKMHDLYKVAQVRTMEVIADFSFSHPEAGVLLF